MIIPYNQLSQEALQGVIEEFVTREGTDYGHEEISFARKCAQVQEQLKAGDIVIVYSADEDTVNLVPADNLSPNL
ncbi:YheU family protein [Halioxenophilus aromaticivorans]|uniref:YheU family protein n=1 Tax=Halioxenophilus aromaticivorans TaxID=1306992 RepID=A0AAV3U5W7_9ALTE